MSLSSADLLQRLGENGPYDQFSYISAMKNHFKHKADKFMTAIDRISALQQPALLRAMPKVYKLKNTDWKMSLLVSSHVDRPKHEALLDFVRDHDLSGKVILELGCCIGTMACALALLNPDAVVIGSDAVENAVAAARLRAANQGIRNVRFVKWDIAKEAPHDLPRNFDMVIAPWVMQEAFADLLVAGAPATEADAMKARNIRNVMRAGGTLLHVDRLPAGLPQQEPLRALLSKSGFATRQTTMLEEPEEVYPLHIAEATDHQ